jgi:hypothetical protein
MREDYSETPSASLLASLFLISSALIAHEIALTRLFSITQWHHFAYMVISVALLGFGASGTFISLFRTFVLARFAKVYTVSAWFYAASIILSYLVTQDIPFDPFLIVWDPRQSLYLFGYCAALFVPFLLAAVCIGVSFVRYAGSVNKLYFANMAGSGFGAVGILLVMYHVRPESLLVVISATAVCAAALSLLPTRKLAAVAISAVGFVPLALIHAGGGLELHVSQFKTLPALMDLPDARIVAQRSSPLGTIDVVSSPAIREAAGMSLSCTAELPPQMALVVDADSVSAVTDYSGDRSRLAYLDCLTSAAVYHAARAKDAHDATVLIVGAGGGTDILAARYAGIHRINALELDPKVVGLMQEELRDFSCNVYGVSGVNVITSEARAFFDSTARTYDVIQISLLDSFSASAAGVLALNESYLYTVEALRSYLDHLNPDGILSITRWLKMPPRDNIKLFATAVEALESFPELSPAHHLIQLRGWKTCTTLIKRTPFDRAEIDAIVGFCRNRSFDLCYFPGIESAVVNHYNVLERPFLYEAATRLLGPDRQEYYRANLFNITPASDDKPYYFHFFRWSSLPELRRMLGTQWVPFVEWGYVILLATLVIAAPLSAVIILLPLLWLHRPARGRSSFAPVLTYFFALGAGYMFVEMVFIQKLARIMPHPIFALAATLTIFLLGSGVGGLTSVRIARTFRRPVLVAFACIAGALAFYVLIVDIAIPSAEFASPIMKQLAACAIAFFLAFFMGIPFPTGLRRLSETSPELLPWAWGINGCASVLGPIIATCFSISLGFIAVMAISALLYLAAALTAPEKTQSRRQR